MFGKGAIILVLGMIILFGVMSIHLNKLENNAIGNMVYYYNTTQSHNLASAGANIGVSRVYQDSSLRGVITSQTFSSGSFAGGSVTVRVDSIDPLTLKVTSISTYQITAPSRKTYSDTIEVSFDKNPYQSFAMYGWLTNNENGVNWTTKDTVWGFVHSNSTLNISGSPVFWKKVTTTKSISPKPGTGLSKGIYKDKYDIGVAPIVFPSNMDSINIAATAAGRKYTSQIWITLSPGTSADNDGKAYIRYTSTGAIVDSISLGDPSFNGVIYGTDSVCIKGTLDGRLTIGSNENIYIVDDVLYERKPETYPSSNDVLGIVANVDVRIPNLTPATTNLEIDGTIFTRTGSFTAEGYNTRTLANSGKLTVLGGIIQNTRGPVGTVDSYGNLATGYSKRYHWDDRLANPSFRPPFFPGFWRKTLAIKNWWENVRIPEF
jgi:hypothetical protein